MVRKNKEQDYRDPRTTIRAVYALGGELETARFDVDPILMDTFHEDYDVAAVVRLGPGASVEAADVLRGNVPSDVEVLWRGCSDPPREGI